MRAAVVPKIGGKWEVREVPTPEPSANQVLIKIHASGLCYGSHIRKHRNSRMQVAGHRDTCWFENFFKELGIPVADGMNFTPPSDPYDIDKIVDI